MELKQVNSNKQIGIEGEQLARRVLKDKGYQVMQADWIGKMQNSDEYHLFETKFQEIFKPPPGHGHGLPCKRGLRP